MSDKSGEQDKAIAYDQGAADERERIAKKFAREALWREERDEDSLLFRSWAREIRGGESLMADLKETIQDAEEYNRGVKDAEEKIAAWLEDADEWADYEYRAMQGLDLSHILAAAIRNGEHETGKAKAQED